MITPSQKKLLDFIREFEIANGYCPSFAEMRDAMGWSAKSNVHRVLGQLEDRGFITRLHGRNRAIRLITNYFRGVSNEELIEECLRRRLIKLEM